jgi:hypothetical protein
MSTDYRKLESLEAEKQEWVLEVTRHAARLIDVVEALKEAGICVSLSTLKRFVRKHRRDEALAAQQDLKETANELVEGAKAGAWREGTLAAARQKFFEKALEAESPEETREVFKAALDQEARLKELELAERRRRRWSSGSNWNGKNWPFWERGNGGRAGGRRSKERRWWRRNQRQ